MVQEIVDIYGRTFKTLRISLTNACNLGCIYCVHQDKDSVPVTGKQLLGYKQLATMVQRIHRITPLDTIRLTGGEPTLYKDLIPFLHELAPLKIPSIKMTSNGYLLKGLLPALHAAGLNKVNISLDAVEQKSFETISKRKNLTTILESIDLALSYGMEIKLNTVVLKTVNEDQILPLLQFAIDRKIPLRFLELMRMGPLYQNSDFERYFFSEQEILDKIQTHIGFQALPREKSATANYWRTEAGYTFGIIANESSPFCHDCTRLRLDSYGNIYGCLSDDTAISITEALDNDLLLHDKLTQALTYKQAVQFKGSALSMMAIGG